MTKSPWTIGTILLALLAASSMAPVATSGGGSDAAHREEYELLRATQDVFRGVAQRVRPFLVKIETVGGYAAAGKNSADGRR